MIIVSMLFSAALVAHTGTRAECAAWYPQDASRQLVCAKESMHQETVAASKRIGALCNELAATAKSHGMVLSSAKLKEGNAAVNCEFKYGSDDDVAKDSAAKAPTVP